MRLLCFLASLICFSANAQTPLRWRNADTSFGALPQGMHVFLTEDSLNGQAFRAAYALVPLKNRALDIRIDTALNRRLLPDSFYKRHQKPPYSTNHLVVNLGYFSFQNQKSLSLLLQNNQVLATNEAASKQAKPKEGFLLPARAAIAVFHNRRADAAWVFTDAASRRWMAVDLPLAPIYSETSTGNISFSKNKRSQRFNGYTLPGNRRWQDVRWAVGGGPMVVQGGAVKVTNEQELLFTGKGIKDKHPRTAIGYTADRQLVIMVVEGRNPQASGATLTELGQLMVQAGCVEALNMDGGGSTCLLINGKPAIKVSDKEGQRPVPSVLIVQHQ